MATEIEGSASGKTKKPFRPNPDITEQHPSTFLNSNASAKRRNLGRSARKRRKKLLEIEAVIAQASAESDFVRLPSDRQYAVPSVSNLCQLSSSDRVALQRQLGYVPGNAVRVVARAGAVRSLLNDADSKDDPIVLQLYPLAVRKISDSTKQHRKRGKTESKIGQKEATESTTSSAATESASVAVPMSSSEPSTNDSDEVTVVDLNNPPDDIIIEPFPTIYWVTHPVLRALISQLELQQVVPKFHEMLCNSEADLNCMKRAHDEYAQTRLALFTQQDNEFMASRKWSLLGRGIAGIRNPRSIKCLHAQAAHFWGGGHDNVVGRWVAEKVEEMLTDRKAKIPSDGSQSMTDSIICGNTAKNNVVGEDP